MKVPDLLRGSPFAQTVHTGGGIIFLQCAAFITSVLIARGLGPEAFGRFQLIVSVSVFATMLATLGLDETIAYLLPKYEATEPAKVFILVGYVLGITCLGSAALGALFYWQAEAVEGLLRVPGISFDTRFLLPLLPCLMLMTMAMAVLRGLGRAVSRAYIYYFLVGSAYLLGVALLLTNGLTSQEAYSVRIASIAVGAAIALFLIYRRNVPARRDRLRWRDMRTLHSFAGWMVFVGVFQYLIDQPLIDLLLVARLDTGALGLYSVAAKAGAVAAIGATALNVVMAPVFARAIAHGDLPALRVRYRQASRWMALAVLASGVMILLFHRHVLLLFGGQFQQASGILQIYAAGLVAAGLLGVNSPVLIASGLTRLEFALSGGACLVLVLLGLLLGRSFGAPGVALASAAATVGLALARRVAVWCVFQRMPQER